MCGITGWISWKRPLTSEWQTIEKMVRTLDRRGPDAFGIKAMHHALFGHTRLTVIDPAGGAQPMSVKTESGEYTLIYNGELYNTDEVRNELKRKGHSFISRSDTEVVLRSYIEWKEECPERFNGIFAFAVWDHKREECFAARDRLGVKPLFYAEKEGELIFGSELKAILAHPEQKALVTLEGLQELLSMGPSRNPGSGVFKGIYELKPAHAFKYTRAGLKKWRYWNVKSENHAHTEQETAVYLRELFEDTVSRQLVSDKPICTFLSGGVDSSAISAAATSHLSENLHTCSISYEENELHYQPDRFKPSDDGPWIQKMSSHLSSVHHDKVISQTELANRLKDAVRARDLPGMADIDSSLLWFCEQVKKDFTVALSGECADEIFGGYPWFQQEKLLTQNGFPWITSVNEREAFILPEWKEKLKLSEYLLEQSRTIRAETPQQDGEASLTQKRREMAYLNMTSFMTTLLDRKDRMSMAAGLEVRVPFADHRIVEYAWNIPWGMKQLGGREKGILRKALEGLLPDEVLYRKKSPYPKTYHPDYTESVKQLLTQSLSKSSSVLPELFERGKIEELIQSDGASFKVPWFGQLMKGPQLIAYLVQLDAWFDMYEVKFDL
ncbi:asparagine synthase (glutamine-hydrolyzing) [Jeotgalibacillus salarius]|uniref:asparagine synthase (glutamine-hydrolyzing) n=1 Tax=Jeotgalibacillus salarius TaxID=546023 RepID=A0A4Y8LH21_9BACL|nr:asparagine synthase (glutamine-hydrolyzing) [Jeotgalibacillus salarius]TFE02092.1 asparagine synthase (glutamine-hydrolyzing) [Jeotgalibacillus salarius]